MTSELEYMRAYSVIQGSPVSTQGKTLFDRQIEDYGAIANRSRKEINHHYINNTDIGTITRSIVAGVVGATVRFQCRTKKEKINKSFEAFWKVFGEKDNFDITGRWHDNDWLRQVETFINVQGGVIVRHHYNYIWKIPYRTELIGIDKIDTFKTIKQDNVQNGIKKNKYGKIIGLYLYNDDVGYSSQSTLYSMENMDYYIESWVSLSQYTAISRFVTILQTIDGKTEYSSAELKAAIERSQNGIFWHSKLYTEIQANIREILKDNLTSEDITKELYAMASKISSSRGSGIDGVRVTPQEDTVTEISNKSASVYQNFADESQKNMAASMGGSQVSSYRDISKGNFSSIKMATALDERELEIKFENLARRIITPILKRLFAVGVQIGKVKLSHEKYFANPEKYHKFDILRTARSVMSEKDEAMANSKNLESGIGMISKLYTQRDGSDYYEDKIKDAEVRNRIRLEETKLAIETEEEINKMYESSSIDRPQEQPTTPSSQKDDDEDEEDTIKKEEDKK